MKASPQVSEHYLLFQIYTGKQHGTCFNKDYPSNSMPRITKTVHPTSRGATTGYVSTNDVKLENPRARNVLVNLLS